MARTNIELDDALLAAAIQLSGARTKREAVHVALEEYVAKHKRHDLRELRGKIQFRDDYDYKRLREGLG